jgi:FkbM family methyltransferase
MLRARGFEPSTIVDAGANVGDWTQIAREIFPAAMIHMIEPQRGCAPALESLASGSAQLHYHRLALTRPGRHQVTMRGGGDSKLGTGAWVSDDDETESPGTRVDATTLDELFTENPRGPILLKLDLEGHELAALEGGLKFLGHVEVVLTEVRFFDFFDEGKPVFADLLSFLRAASFELYDIASLSGRPRDQRLRLGDVVFVRRDSVLLTDLAWE